jgi:hypothetical protein
MSGWPLDEAPSLPVMSAWATEAIGQALVAQGGRLDGATSGTYTTANRAILIPFTPKRDMRPALWYWQNGAAVSGNLEVGVWDYALQKVASSGSVAQAGVSAYQTAAVAGSPVLRAGRTYYLVLCCDNTTAAYIRVATAGGASAGLGQLMLATSLPLPASLVGAVVSNQGNFPHFGFTERSFL